MSSPGAMILKGSQLPETKNGGLTMYAFTSNPYQQMAMTSCYQPMTGMLYTIINIQAFKYV